MFIIADINQVNRRTIARRDNYPASFDCRASSRASYIIYFQGIGSFVPYPKTMFYIAGWRDLAEIEIRIIAGYTGIRRRWNLYAAALPHLANGGFPLLGCLILGIFLRGIFIPSDRNGKKQSSKQQNCYRYIFASHLESFNKLYVYINIKGNCHKVIYKLLGGCQGIILLENAQGYAKKTR